MRKHQQAKKNHHYVWADYLRRWALEKDYVYCLTEKKNIRYDPVTAMLKEDFFYKVTPLSDQDVKLICDISSQCSPDYQELHMKTLAHYLQIQEFISKYRQLGVANQEADQLIKVLECNAMENTHTEHENLAKYILAELADERLDVLQDKQNMLAFSSFLGMQFVRTKASRDSLIVSFSKKSSNYPDFLKSLKNSWWFISYMFGMNMGASLYLRRNINRQTLLINDSSVPFITSDQPVINIHPCLSNETLGIPTEVDYYYPISPRVAFVFSESDIYPSGNYKVNESTVIELNSKVASQAWHHIISSSKESLSPFIKFVGNRMNTTKAVFENR